LGASSRAAFRAAACAWAAAAAAGGGAAAAAGGGAAAAAGGGTAAAAGGGAWAAAAAAAEAATHARAAAPADGRAGCGDFCEALRAALAALHPQELHRQLAARAAAAAAGGATWDARYGGAADAPFYYGEAPNDWLAEHEPRLPRGARVLCLAEGEGRNAVFLAARGHAVTAVDLSPVGVAKTLALAARRGVAVAARVGDLAELRIEPGAWDAVVSIWAHVPRALRRALHAAAAAGLAPGGLLIFEAYHPRQLARVAAGAARGGPATEDLLATLADVQAEVAGLEPVAAAERDREVSEGAGHAGVSAVTQLVARRGA